MERAAAAAPTIANSSGARCPSTSINVIAGVGEMRSSPPAKVTIPLRACSTRSAQPANPGSSREPGKTISRPLSRSASDGDAPGGFSVARASGRFHGSTPGIASRVTSMASRAPSLTPLAPLGSRYSTPHSATAMALRPLVPMLVSRASITVPAGIDPSSSTRASTISPSSTMAARVSPMPRSISHSGKVVSGRLQQHSCLGKRQPDNVGIAAGDIADVDLAVTLQRIAAGLAAPFAVARIIVDLVCAQALHRDHRLDPAFAHAVAGNGQGNGSEYAVAPAGQQLHAGAQGGFVLDLGQDPPPDRDDSVGRQHQRFGLRGGDGFGLF